MSDERQQYAWMSHSTSTSYATANPQPQLNYVAMYNGSYVSSGPPIQPPLSPNPFGQYWMQPPMVPSPRWMVAAAGGMFTIPMSLGNISFSPNHMAASTPASYMATAASVPPPYFPGLARAFAMQPYIPPRAHVNAPRQSDPEPPKIEMLDNSPVPPPAPKESSQKAKRILPSNPPPQPAPVAADPPPPQMKRLRVDSLNSYVAARAREALAANLAGGIFSSRGTTAGPAPVVALAAPAPPPAASSPAPVTALSPASTSAPGRRSGKEHMTDKGGIIDMWPAPKGLWEKKWLPNGSSLMIKKNRDEAEGELRPSIKAMALMGRVIKEKHENPCVLVRKGPVTVWYTKG